MYQFSYVKMFSINHGAILLLLDDLGRVRSQIISVVCQIQRFDFDCNLVVTRKLITLREALPAGVVEPDAAGGGGGGRVVAHGVVVILHCR
jgi:hypothetical protein